MRHHKRLTDLPQLAQQPLIDIVLVLLLFFVMIWSKPAATGLDLTSRSAPSCWFGPSKAHYLRLYSDGRIELSDSDLVFSQADLASLGAEVSRLKQDPHYLNAATLMVDAKLPVGDAVAVTQQLKALGLSRIFWERLSD